MEANLSINLIYFNLKGNSGLVETFLFFFLGGRAGGGGGGGGGAGEIKIPYL